MNSTNTNWSMDEINTMLDMIIERDSYHQILDNKRQRNIELFYEISNELSKCNMHKSAVQCRSKFKLLKSKYLEEKAKSKKSGSGSIKWRYFEKMNNILGGRPVASALAHGVETELGGACSSNSSISVISSPPPPSLSPLPNQPSTSTSTDEPSAARHSPVPTSSTPSANIVSSPANVVSPPANVVSPPVRRRQVPNPFRNRNAEPRQAVNRELSAFQTAILASFDNHSSAILSEVREMLAQQTVLLDRFCTILQSQDLSFTHSQSSSAAAQTLPRTGHHMPPSSHAPPTSSYAPPTSSHVTPSHAPQSSHTPPLAHAPTQPSYTQPLSHAQYTPQAHTQPNNPHSGPPSSSVYGHLHPVSQHQPMTSPMPSAIFHGLQVANDID